MADVVVDVTQIEERLAALEEKVASAPTQPASELEARVAKLEQYLRDLPAKGHTGDV